MNEQTESVETIDAATGDIAYNEMSWQKLKALVNAEGREYIDIPTSIKFLNELDGAEEIGDTQSEVEKDLEEAEIAEEVEEVEIIDTPEEVVTGEDLVVDPDDGDKTPVFDPDENHGIIAGTTNAKYWQNGCSFDNHGVYIAPEDVT